MVVMSDASPSDIAKRLRLARESVGISARECDRRAGLTEGHTSLVETGTRGIEAPTAAKLAVALGVSLDWLVLGRGAGPSRPSKTGTEG
jgi:transcriptional regulator with XRE-family HTH domain